MFFNNLVLEVLPYFDKNIHWSYHYFFNFLALKVMFNQSLFDQVLQFNLWLAFDVKKVAHQPLCYKNKRGVKKTLKLFITENICNLFSLVIITLITIFILLNFQVDLTIDLKNQQNYSQVLEFHFIYSFINLVRISDLIQVHVLRVNIFFFLILIKVLTYLVCII